MKTVEITLRLTINIPKTGITINGIVFKLREIMSTIALLLLQAIFEAIEERAIEALREKYPGRYTKAGHQSKPRQLRTSFGKFQYRFAQLQDKKTNKTVFPIITELKIPPYKRYIAESMEAATGLAVHVSYQRASKEVERILDTAPSRSSLHRFLNDFSNTVRTWPNLKSKRYRFLMVDGTTIKRQGHKGQSLGKTQLRWAMAATSEKRPFVPVGFYVDSSWSELAADLKKRLSYKNLQVLIADDEPGIRENLLEKGMLFQRCIFHGLRDFPYILYTEYLKKHQQMPYINHLRQAPVFSLSQSDVEQLSKDDIPSLKRFLRQTKRSFNDLIQSLGKERYPKATTYLENLKRDIATFITYWLKTRRSIPITTNIIESGFSRFVNRVKHIGRRWSDQGLLRWLMVMMHKIFLPHTWDTLWNRYMDIHRTFKVLDSKVEYKWIYS